MPDRMTLHDAPHSGKCQRVGLLTRLFLTDPTDPSHKKGWVTGACQAHDKAQHHLKSLDKFTHKFPPLSTQMAPSDEIHPQSA
jgi:hypothetical protein